MTKLITVSGPAITTLRQLGVAALVAAALAACNQPTPEARLEAVGEDLSDSASELDSLNERIESTEALLETLRDERDGLRDKVRTLKQRLEARATDVAVFRAVQSALLEDETLKESAIGVSVEDGRVTLSGVALSEQEVGRALAVARNIVGVEGVYSRIRVKDPAAVETGGS